MQYTLIAAVAAVLLVGGAWWSGSQESASAPASDDPNVIATDGLHWHPHIEIYVDGEKQLIPQNIGIGPQYASMPSYDARMRMTAVHTHDPDGTIHFEFSGVVTREDTKLGNFFRIWGKDFMEFGDIVTMTVNGEENTELEEYEMKDEDQIVLRYE